MNNRISLSLPLPVVTVSVAIHQQQMMTQSQLLLHSIVEDSRNKKSKNPNAPVDIVNEYLIVHYSAQVLHNVWSLNDGLPTSLKLRGNPVTLGNV